MASRDPDFCRTWESGYWGEGVEPLDCWASFAKQPTPALKKLFLRCSWCPSCHTLSFCRERGYWKEELLFTKVRLTAVPLVQGPTWNSRSQPCPEHTCKGGGPSTMQDSVPNRQPERAPRERHGGAVRARRGSLGPKDRDFWLPPRGGEGRGHSRRLRAQR